MKLLELFARPLILKEGIEHFEDTVFTKGSAGAKRATDLIAGLEKKPDTVTVKWDGFPAVVFGRDPEGNLVFVDKHQFEKVAKGKENFSTIQEYDKKRGASRTNLWSAEDMIRPTLEKVVPQTKDKYWMGDLMWTGTPSVQNGYYVFKPNTVEYKVKIDQTPGEGDSLSDKIARSTAGIAVHTYIPGLGSGDEPLVGLKGLDDNGGITFLVGEMKDKPRVLVNSKVKADTDKIIDQHDEALDKFLEDLKSLKASSVITAVSPFITSMLEEDDIATNIVPRFLEFLKTRLSSAAQEKLLGANQDGWLYQEDGGGPGLLAMWTIWAALVDLKMHVKKQIDSQQDGSEVIATIDGESAHEGYVLGGGAEKVKLVDRLGFTRANFARHKPKPEEVAEKQAMPAAVFTFGRMNPPTLGHKLVLDKVVELGGKNGYIFLSSSQSPTNDPLDPQTKKAFIRTMYPQYADNIVDDPVHNALFAANWLYDEGFRNMIFVGGSDRLGKSLNSIEKLLNNWNSGPIRSTDYQRGPKGREYVYLDFVSSGDRDPDAEGVEGFSGTKARKAASSGNEQMFQQFTGVGPEIKVNGLTLYQSVRKAMGISDEPTQAPAASAAPKVKVTKKPAQPPTSLAPSTVPQDKTVPLGEDVELTMARLIDKIIVNEAMAVSKMKNLARENGDEAGEVKLQKNLIPMPKGTVKVDVDDTLDWYNLGMTISDLDDADPEDFGKGPPETVIVFGTEPEEHKYIKQLKRLGLPIHDIDETISTEVDLERPYNTEKQILTRIRQIMHDRKLSGTESNVVELHRLKQKLKDIRSQQGIAEGSGFDQEAGIGIDGKSFKFKIRDLVALADKYPVTKIEPQQFSQQIADRDEDPTQSMARAEKADLQYPIIVVKRQNGQLWIADGTHRAHKAILNKLPNINAKIIPIKDMAPFDVNQGVNAKLNVQFVKQDVAENFADGKNPGRKGLAKRMGVPTKASVSKLRKIAKTSSGEKARMAHFIANMKSGRKK